MQREAEYSPDQRELLVALNIYESSIGPHGLPVDETMSALADPDNPRGTHYYAVDVMRDWAEFAIESERNKPQWSGDNYLSSRHFRARRVDRPPAD